MARVWGQPAGAGAPLQTLKIQFRHTGRSLVWQGCHGWERAHLRRHPAPALAWQHARLAAAAAGVALFWVLPAAAGADRSQAGSVVVLRVGTTKP